MNYYPKRFYENMDKWIKSKKKTEFCSILNEFIRNDQIEAIDHVSTISHCLNLLCVIGRHDPIKIKWPDSYILYRGGGLPDDKKFFFQIGKKYRCPMFLATSTNEETSQKFCRRAQIESKLPPVLFEFEIDKKYKCYHVNYVDKTNIPGEDEFLFSPYSVFTVISVNFKEEPNWMEPHRIRLQAAVDNLIEKENLPLSPWH